MPTIPQLRAIRSLVTATSACALAVALGCSKNNPSAPPPIGPSIYSSIVITGPDTLLIGDSGLFTATVTDTGGNRVISPNITYSSSASGVASISNAGTAQGVSEGDVTIRASGGSVSSNALPLVVLQGFGWVDQSSAAPTVQNLRGVHFVNSSQGWIVGELGTILHTTDAGQTWKAQKSFSTGYTLNAVTFVSPLVGIVVGSLGRILRTNDGAISEFSWKGVSAPALEALNDVCFQAYRGWIVGDNGVILRSEDGGGERWTRVLSPTTANLESVSFPPYTLGGSPPADPYGRGWAVGAGGTILTSSDFGQTWRVVSPFVTTDGLLGVARISKFDAIAVGSNDRVLNTFANGDSAIWQLAPPPAPMTNFAAIAWSPRSPVPGSAWAVGKQSVGPTQAIVFYSSDGGGSWIRQVLPGSALPSGNGLEDVFFLDDNHGWAVGTQGLILHTATGGK